MSEIRAYQDVECVYLDGADITADGCVWFDPGARTLGMVTLDKYNCTYRLPGTTEVATHMRAGQIGLRLYRNAPLQFAIDMHAAGVEVSVGDEVHWEFRARAD
jgi:hypothetical protein